jgi:hypothetical protein
LDGEDLVNSEAMFRLWRDVVQAGTPCKILFHRQIGNLPLWRNVQKKLESNQLTLRTGQYRGVCKDTPQVQLNWRTGNFKKFTYPVTKFTSEVNRPDSFKLTIGDDCVAWNCSPSVKPKTNDGCAFLDTESMEITEIPLYCMHEIVNGMLVRRGFSHTGSTVSIWNPKFNWTIKEKENDFGSICSGSGLLVYESHSRDRGQRIEVWKMGNPPTLLRTRTFEDRQWKILKVDERFIVASESCYKPQTLFFISTETLQEFTSLKAMNYECYLHEGEWGETSPVSRKLVSFDCQYDQGLLFQYQGDGLVRILDVATGSNVNNVRIPFQSEDTKFIQLLDTWVSSNSKVMVIGWKYLKDRNSRVSHLSVYDLEAVKKPNSDPGSHLLYTLQFQCDIHSFVMNENEIVFRAFSGKDGYWYVKVLKFANFSVAERKSSDLKEKPEDVGDSNEEIVQMKVKKIIYDRLDFDCKDKDNEDFKKEVKMKMKKIVGDLTTVDYGLDKKNEEDKDEDEQNEMKMKTRMNTRMMRMKKMKENEGNKKYESNDKECECLSKIIIYMLLTYFLVR